MNLSRNSSENNASSSKVAGGWSDGPSTASVPNAALSLQSKRMPRNVVKDELGWHGCGGDWTLFLPLFSQRANVEIGDRSADFSTVEKCLRDGEDATWGVCSEVVWEEEREEPTSELLVPHGILRRGARGQDEALVVRRSVIDRQLVSDGAGVATVENQNRVSEKERGYFAQFPLRRWDGKLECDWGREEPPEDVQSEGFHTKRSLHCTWTDMSTRKTDRITVCGKFLIQTLSRLLHERSKAKEEGKKKENGKCTFGTIIHSKLFLFVFLKVPDKIPESLTLPWLSLSPSRCGSPSMTLPAIPCHQPGQGRWSSLRFGIRGRKMWTLKSRLLRPGEDLERNEQANRLRNFVINSFTT